MIDNALDAMEAEGGELSIRTEKVGDNINVKISDSGPGIPADLINQIFDPFFTTKDVGKGTGLVLETVKQIVEKHHATINVDSAPGKTTFEFCFPIKANN